MSTTKSFREVILENTIIVLKTIKIANSFRTTVNEKNISRLLESPDEMDADDFPALFVSDGVEAIEYGTNKELINKFNVIISGYVRYNKDGVDQAGTIPSTQLNRLLSDVKEVLLDTDKVLWKTGGVQYVRLVQVDTDEGFLEPDAVFRLQAEVEYWHQNADAGALI